MESRDSAGPGSDYDWEVVIAHIVSPALAKTDPITLNNPQFAGWTSMLQNRYQLANVCHNRRFVLRL
ncbi:MAG TPA: hypothetical protein VFM35_01405 [Candidatus Binatia bacterium]|nr:hypothetical protein [Candidatus Binatia bacterium]